jgi:exodeoxyribonuclease VII large subunit
MIEQDSARQIFSISELNRRVRQLLEINIPMLWVEGEISNFACPGLWALVFEPKGLIGSGALRHV